MTPTPPTLPPAALPPADQQSLDAAAHLLHTPRLAMRLANLAGRPFDGAMRLLPDAETALHRAVHQALLHALTIAIESRDGQSFAPSAWRARAVTGLAGGVGGLFGNLLLPLEIPLTVTMMLRGIVDIAAEHGEDLTDLEARLACLQVFALGERRRGAEAAIGYYAVRATLNRMTGRVVAAMIERGTLDASAPVVTRLLGEIAARFGFVLTERAAASTLPLLGALTGSALNVLFMDHFERIARGHFTIRRLERRHGAERIQQLYRRSALTPPPGR